MSAPTITPLEALRRLIAEVKQLDAVEVGARWNQLQGELGVAEGVVRDYVEPNPVGPVQTPQVAYNTKMVKEAYDRVKNYYDPCDAASSDIWTIVGAVPYMLQDLALAAPTAAVSAAPSGEVEEQLRGEGWLRAMSDVCAFLPCSYYMDPPDGGSVTVLDQVERMSKDAERYRYIRNTGTLDTLVWLALEGDGLINDAGDLDEVGYRLGLDRAVDISIKDAAKIATLAPDAAIIKQEEKLSSIVPDWPFCNPGCDYEDPHGGRHDGRSVSCSCEAAKASIAGQSAAITATKDKS